MFLSQSSHRFELYDNQVVDELINDVFPYQMPVEVDLQRSLLTHFQAKLPASDRGRVLIDLLGKTLTQFPIDSVEGFQDEISYLRMLHSSPCIRRRKAPGQAP